MPTYEYKCTQCGREIEAVQKFSDAPLSICDECGGELRKVFSSVGVVFKGSGFYKTDSRSGKSAATPPASTVKESSGTESKSTDATPAAPSGTSTPAAATTSSTANTSSTSNSD